MFTQMLPIVYLITLIYSWKFPQTTEVIFFITHIYIYIYKYMYVM